MTSPTQETPVRELRIGAKPTSPARRGRPAVYGDQAAKSRAQREREALLKEQIGSFLEAFVSACERGHAHPFIDHLPENLGERLVTLTGRLESRKLVVCQRDDRPQVAFDLDLPGTAPYIPDSDTSQEAAATIAPFLPACRREILTWHAAHGPATDNDCIHAWERADRNTNGIRARRGELVRAGLIRACGRRDGSTLWEVTELGRMALEAGE